ARASSFPRGPAAPAPCAPFPFSPARRYRVSRWAWAPPWQPAWAALSARASVRPWGQASPPPWAAAAPAQLRLDLGRGFRLGRRHGRQVVPQIDDHGFG